MTRFTSDLFSKPAPRCPGDTRRRMTRPASDVEGTRYPRGTYFNPIAGGYDNARQSQYADVVILGTA
jgi:hypothetical protein